MARRKKVSTSTNKNKNKNTNKNKNVVNVHVHTSGSKSGGGKTKTRTKTEYLTPVYKTVLAPSQVAVDNNYHPPISPPQQIPLANPYDAHHRMFVPIANTVNEQAQRNNFQNQINTAVQAHQATSPFAVNTNPEFDEANRERVTSVASSLSSVLGTQTTPKMTGEKSVESPLKQLEKQETAESPFNMEAYNERIKKSIEWRNQQALSSISTRMQGDKGGPSGLSRLTPQVESYHTPMHATPGLRKYSDVHHEEIEQSSSVKNTPNRKVKYIARLDKYHKMYKEEADVERKEFAHAKLYKLANKSALFLEDQPFLNYLNKKTNHATSTIISKLNQLLRN